MKNQSGLKSQDTHMRTACNSVPLSSRPCLVFQLCTDCHLLLTNCCKCWTFVINVFTAHISHHSCINSLIKIKQAINDSSSRPTFLKVATNCCHYISSSLKDTIRLCLQGWLIHSAFSCGHRR